MAKLWEKNFEVNAEIDRYTVGRDRELDLYLAQDDVLGSMAHITMLESIGLLKKEELEVLLAELKKIYRTALDNTFTIEDGVEDVHSQVELLLTQRLGDVGKKIHSGRSRNDQVLVDLKLFTRRQLRHIVEDVHALFTALQEQSERYKNVLMPGSTRLSFVTARSRARASSRVMKEKRFSTVSAPSKRGEKGKDPTQRQRASYSSVSPVERRTRCSRGSSFSAVTPARRTARFFSKKSAPRQLMRARSVLPSR